MPTVTIEIEKLAKWGPVKKVQTKFGARNLRTASANQDFWAAWEADRQGLQAMGVGCGKNRETSEWEVQWWQQVEGQAEAEAASQAVSTKAVIPHPYGLDYFPFQKAGIEFALRAFGDLK